MCQQESVRRTLPQSLAIQMIPVIRRVAYRLAKRLPPHVCVDDLISAGLIGLINAYDRFDPSLCGDFGAYAELRIRGAMLDDLRAADPLSRDLRAHATRTKAARRTLESRLERAPSEAEIAAEMGLSLATYQTFTARAAVGPTVSLDAPGDGGSSLQIGDPDDIPVDERVVREQSRLKAHQAIGALPPRLKQVVTLYYGDEWTLRDIGTFLGVTESRVCQLQAEALQRMRAHCAGSEPSDRPAPGSRRAARIPRREASAFQSATA